MPASSIDNESENSGPRKINVVLNRFEEPKGKVPVERQAGAQPEKEER